MIKSTKTVNSVCFKKAHIAINMPLKVMTSIFLGALVLGGLTFLMKDIILPNIDNRTTSLFESDIEGFSSDSLKIIEEVSLW